MKVQCTGSPGCGQDENKKNKCPHFGVHEQSEKYACSEGSECYSTKKRERCKLVKENS